MSPETSMVTRGRWLRAGVFALAMAVLAATAHLVAGGHLPGTRLTILAGLLIGCLSYPITRRDRGIGAIVATTVAAQGALHIAFTLPMAGLAAASAGAGSAGAGHMAMPTGSSGVSVEQVWTALRLDSPTPAMVVAHAAAAVVLALGLRRGEQALLDLAASVRAFFGVLVAVVTGRLEAFVPGSDAAAYGPSDVVRLIGTLLGSDHRERGPPVVLTH